ncbi:hypothetical protein F4678DRAFT_483959 [Xylaria arbuscula]|nr:hypothetical protein F4678DRAFT_483959 [Xylaria arbuscula]
MLAKGVVLFSQQGGPVETDVSVDSRPTTTDFATSTSSQSMTSATLPAESSNSAGLSRGFIAGISVVSVVAGVLLIGAIALLISRRWTRSTKAQSTMVETEQQPHSELPQSMQDYNPPQHKSELSPHERPAQSHELDAER